MGCLSGKELQGIQLAVKHRFKQAVAPGHLARLTLQKDPRVEHGSQIGRMVSCCAAAPAPPCAAPNGCSGRVAGRGPRGPRGRPVGGGGVLTEEDREWQGCRRQNGIKCRWGAVREPGGAQGVGGC